MHEAVQSQQAYMTVLSGHINTLYTKLVHLDKQVQIHCIYPHPQSDIIQLNAPDYDPDIDRDLDPATDIQPLNAQTDKEDTSTSTPKTEDHTTIPLITNRPEHQPSEVLPDIDSTEYDNIPVITNPNWKTSQNYRQMKKTDADLLYNHNSTEESDRIHHEYSAYFEKVKDQEYNPYHTVQGIKYYIPEPDYYHTNT